MTNSENGWRLETLNISYQNWGEFKDKFIGKVTFQNKMGDAFMFTLNEQETQEYINLVSQRLVHSASHLGDKLLNSLNLLPAPRVVEIQE